MMERELSAKSLGLTITYRCPKSVVAEASVLVPDYRAAESAPDGKVSSMTEEAMMSTVTPGDAILSRTNAPMMPLCLSLLRKGIAARIEGRDIGKQLVGIIKSLKARSIPQLIEKIEKWGDKMKNRFRNSKHAEAQCELVNDQVATLLACVEGLTGVSEVEPRIMSLFQDTDGNSKPSVVFSSVHKAKGLEWNRVFILRRTFKIQQADDTVSDEANIYYVAITRAKQELVMLEK